MKIKAGIDYPLNCCLDREKLQLQYSRIYQDEEETLTQQISISKKYSRKYFVYETDELELSGVMDFTLQKDVPRSGLVAELLFFEGSGTTCRDWSDNNNDATLYGGVTWKQLASGKWVLELDGSTGYGQIPHSTSLIIDKEFTVIAWGFIKSLATYHFEIVNKEAWNVWRFFVHKDHQKLEVVQNTDIGVLARSGEIVVPLNRWNQFAVSFKSGNIVLYINGEVDKTYVDTYNTLATNTLPLHIGRYGTTYTDGQFGLLRIYNKALTQSEIQSIYNLEKPIFQG